MNLYVDDLRPCPDGWLPARTVADAKLQLMRDDIEAVALDHDMGACADCVAAGTHVGESWHDWCPHVEDGYSLVQWMIEHGRVPATVRVHTMNPVGLRRMIAALNEYNARTSGA